MAKPTDKPDEPETPDTKPDTGDAATPPAEPDPAAAPDTEPDTSGDGGAAPDAVPDTAGPESQDGPPPTGGAIKPAMTEAEIRAAGLAVDVPFESGEPQPDRLRYADLGKKWTPPPGWPPDQGEPQDPDDQNA